MRLQVISTGSKANSYILTCENGRALLLDAGVTIKELEKALGKAWPNLCGALITHEHMDHARSVKDLLPIGVPVYASPGTREALQMPGICPVLPKSVFALPDPSRHGCDSGIMVMAFRVQHDAAEAVGYLIQDTDTRERFLYATDFYCRREDVKRYQLPGVHYWLIECNFCEDLIEPEDIIDQRRTDNHMSLGRLKDILAANDLTEARKIILCHLSDKKSDEARMVEEVARLTHVETTAARKRMNLALELSPF